MPERTSNFHKVVQQHTEGMVGNVVWVLLEIFLAFQEWKNFENPLRIVEVITMSLVYYFFVGTQCRCPQYIVCAADLRSVCDS